METRLGRTATPCWAALRALSWLLGSAVTGLAALPALAAPLEIRSVTPAAVSFPSGMAPGPEVHLTVAGQGLDGVRAVRVTRSGSPVTAFRPEFKVPVQRGDLMAIKLQPHAALTPGNDYRVELQSGQEWVPLGARVVVYLAVRPPGAKPDRALLMNKEALTAAILQRRSRQFGGTLPSNLTPIQSPPVRALITETGADIQDYFPKAHAGLGDTLVLFGKGLEAVTAVRVGEHTLAPVKQFTDARGQHFVYRVPSLRQRYTGDLVVTSKSRLANGRELEIPRVLARGYSLVDAWAEFVPKVTLSDLEAHTNDRPYDHRFWRFRFENIPGQSISRAQDLFPKYFNSGFQLDFVTDRGFQVTEDSRFFYGGTFEVSVAGKITSQRFNGFRFRFTVQRERETKLLDLVRSHALQPVVEYTVSNTGDLSQLLNVTRISAWGLTDGISDLGAGPVRVGSFTDDGDLTFRIASGPIGTAVTWQSNALQMNDGWIIARTEWEVTKEGPAGQTVKARLGPGAGGIGYTFDRVPERAYSVESAGTFPAPDGKPPLMMYFEEYLRMGDESYWAGGDSMQWYARPFQLRLSTDATLLNDHRITVKLKSVTFRGPSGKTWRDAIARSVDPSGLNILIGGTDSYGRTESTLQVFQPG